MPRPLFPPEGGGGGAGWDPYYLSPEDRVRARIRAEKERAVARDARIRIRRKEADYISAIEEHEILLQNAKIFRREAEKLRVLALSQPSRALREKFLQDADAKSIDAARCDALARSLVKNIDKDNIEIDLGATRSLARGAARLAEIEEARAKGFSFGQSFPRRPPY